ncbi:MAG: SIR2 family protein [Elusimicrobia bacterium]|nr:SIR2 family protein [Elusimicrobiota bacterium]
MLLSAPPLIEQKKYPEIFQVVSDCVGRENLVAFIREQFEKVNSHSELTDLLASFPFVFYLTTNYDNLIKKSLEKNGIAVTSLYNDPESLNIIASHTRNVVVKLHGDISRPPTLILTSNDYRKIKVDSSFEYFRMKLQSVFHMFDVLFVGYRLSDSHFEMMLEELSNVLKGSRPIFAFVPDATTFQIKDWRLKYNVEIIPYKTVKNSHKDLIAKLKQIQVFVEERSQTEKAPPEIPDNIQKAGQLFLFTSFQLKPGSIDFKMESYKAVLLFSLLDITKAISLEDLITTIPFKPTVTTPNFGSLLHIAANSLKETELIIIEQDNKISLTEKGKRHCEEIKSQAKYDKEKFLAQVALDVERSGDVPPQNKTHFVKLVQDCVELIFHCRGAEIAGVLFAGGSFDLKGSSDIFQKIKSFNEGLSSETERAFFTHYIVKVFSYPQSTQINFLSHLAQAYFSYHALNLDPDCKKIQSEILSQTAFFIDSNVIIPLLAKGSFNHQTAKDLFDLAKNSGAKLFTTRRILKEVLDHAQFAIEHAEPGKVRTTQFLRLALGYGGYKQNRFIDGFINRSDEEVLEFSEYIEDIFGRFVPHKLLNNPGKFLPDVVCIDPDSLGILDNESTEKNALAIQQYREERGTFRHYDQCRAEAEIFRIMESIGLGVRMPEVFCGTKEAVFVSQSPVLNRFRGEETKFVWTPQTLYWYLSCFASPKARSYSWQEFLEIDAFRHGFPIVNEEKYKRFFSAPIKQSKMKFETQLNFLKRIRGEEFTKDIEEKFVDAPELDKPLFVETVESYLEKEVRKVKILTAQDRRELEALRKQRRDRYDYAKRQRRARKRQKK